MNQAYFNGPYHEWEKRFKKDAEEIPGVIHWLCYIILFHFCFIRYLWSIPDGPVFIVKLWILIMDVFYAGFYSFNKNPICRSQNHSSVLSKKQNIGWFLKYNLYNIEAFGTLHSKPSESLILEGTRK